MTDHIWWACHTCGEEMYDSVAVLHHREGTGHVGASILSDKVPTAGPGSTEEGRRRAREIYEATRTARRTTVTHPSSEEQR